MAGWLDELFNAQAPADLRGLLGNFGMYNAPGPMSGEAARAAEEQRLAEEARQVAAARMARQMRPDRDTFGKGLPPGPDMYGATAAFQMPQFAGDPNAAPPSPAPTDVGGGPQPSPDQPTPVQTVTGSVADRPIGGIPPNAQGSAGPAGAIPSTAAGLPPPAGPAPFFPGQELLGRIGSGVMRGLRDNSAGLIAGGGAMISGGLGHGLSAMAAASPLDIAARKERQGNEAIQATYNALIQAGHSPAAALAGSQNPEILKTLVAKPTWGVIGEDPFTGAKKYGFIDPISQTVGGPANARGAPAGAGVGGVNADLVGEDYLKQFPPEMQDAVKNYVHGISAPSANARQGFTQAVKMAASKYGADIGMPAEPGRRCATGSARQRRARSAARSTPATLPSATCRNWPTTR